MNLAKQVKQKNEQLNVQKVFFLHHLTIRAQVPDSSSFAVTFIAAPFILGAALGFATAARHLIPSPIRSALLPGVRIPFIF